MKSTTSIHTISRFATTFAVALGLLVGTAGSASAAAITGTFEVVDRAPGAPANVVNTVTMTGLGAPGAGGCPGGLAGSVSVNAGGICTNFNPDPVRGVAANDYVQWNLPDAVGNTVWGGAVESQVQVVFTAGPGGAANPLLAGGPVTGPLVIPPANVASQPVARVVGGVTNIMFKAPNGIPAGVYKYQVQFLNGANAVQRTADPNILVPAMPPFAVFGLAVVLVGASVYMMRKRSALRLSA